ncbi:MAG: hypothetical protein N3F06_02445, partial [Nitrososphaerales archaeon]|nr:hypothetical protein [Nitrososphaerales archaeon]
NELYKILEEESKSEKLIKIRRTLYKDVATYIKMIKANTERNDHDVVSKLIMRERELIIDLVERLLRLRINKIIHSMSEVEYVHLTPEEKYIVESINLSVKKYEKIKRAIWNGQPSVLEFIAEKMASKYTVVRFLQPSPPIVGTDLTKYGPFQKEDVAVLPSDNAWPLIKRGIAVELWDID